MIDLYLQNAIEKQARADRIDALTKAMSVLPVEELQKIACSGLREPSGLAPQDEWLAAYKGTPLFDKAIQLAHQIVELSVQQSQLHQQRDAAQDMTRVNLEQLEKQQDLLRVQKRVLGLELAQWQQANSAPVAPAATQEEPHPPMALKEAAARFKKAAGIAAPAIGAAAGGMAGAATSNKDSGVVGTAARAGTGALAGAGLAAVGQAAHAGLQAYDPSLGRGAAYSALSGINHVADSYSGKQGVTGLDPNKHLTHIPQPAAHPQPPAQPAPAQPMQPAAPPMLPQKAGPSGNAAPPKPLVEVVSPQVKQPGTVSPPPPAPQTRTAARSAERAQRNVGTEVAQNVSNRAARSAERAQRQAGRAAVRNLTTESVARSAEGATRNVLKERLARLVLGAK